MKVKLYERRYWNIQVGKVFAVFDMDPDADIFKNEPSSTNFWIWLDDKPEVLEIDVQAAINKFDSGKHSGLADTGMDVLPIPKGEI